jgi:hypothetical protein
MSIKSKTNTLNSQLTSTYQSTIRANHHHHENEKRNPYIQNFYNQSSQPKQQFTDATYLPVHPKDQPIRRQEAPMYHPERLASSGKSNQGKQHKLRYREKTHNTVYTGILKFFDEKNGFGFVTSIDKFCDSFDVFVYQNEFRRAKIDMEIIRLAKKKAVITLQFQTALYTGKNTTGKKAVNIQLIDVKLPPN